ncbi:DUF262 domain-containing protein [Actinomadura sp. GC306]|uniref:GmrSD restriction endonuclease domain-containing protein n=1 Tax=Actinomadura sp. GC306 TaxID=2530367 RepID=UPI00104C3F35|nr:DUF262 domain-containing protein [Actinomadura sp. GC306]TDC68223.1 DUF262 domain-containing protein [Actinomadura sp. GC306]
MVSAYDADPIFETQHPQLSNLITRIRSGDLALPNFQRDFVWEPQRTVELLRSVISRYPVGTLLFWKQNRDEPAFAYRNFEEAPQANQAPAELVLDGQQRLTSLYQALTGSGDEKYFFKLDEFVENSRVLEVHEIDFEKAIHIQPLNGRKRQEVTFSQEDSFFGVFEVEKFDDWLDSYAEQKGGGDRQAEKHIKQLYRGVRDRYLVPLRSYGFPLVSLPESTPLEAVCTIFETLNRTGKQLGVFELLTARFYPKGVNLRELWQEAQESYEVFEEFKIDPYSVLQAICLRSHKSAQRADVLKRLTADDIEEHWTPVLKGFIGSLDLLEADCGVLSPKWLPYSMILVPMAAAWPEIQALKPLERATPRRKLQQYFWCTVFTGNFDQGANSQAGADHAKLKEWLGRDDSPAPEAIADFNVTASSIRSATTRRKALYAGLLCLTVAAKAQDFHTGQTMTQSRVRENKIDSHHIFPKAFLVRNSFDESSELILNRALIDADTNRIIRDKAPSVYLPEMMEAHGREKLESVMISHAIPFQSTEGALAEDRYSDFLDKRLELVIELIESVTERTVLRNDLEA